MSYAKTDPFEAPFPETDTQAPSDVVTSAPNIAAMTGAAAAAHMLAAMGYTDGLTSDATYAEPLPLTLCAAGPCRNFFRAVVVQDIQGNLDGSPVKPLLGTLTSCYPNPGNEIDDIPETVLECTRHDPVDLVGVSEIKAALQAWRARQRA